jgi:two-component system sensor histidine kinase EvgS
MLRVLTLLTFVLLTGCSKQKEQVEPNVASSTQIRLTVEEQEFIKTRKEVTWAVEDNRPPFVYVDNERVKGLSADYVRVIELKTGLKLKPVRVSNLRAALDAVNKGKIDIVSGVRATADRLDVLDFSDPYSYNAGVFVFRQNSAPSSPLRAGICQGDAAVGYLKDRFPDMQIVETQDIEEAISLLEKGLLDVAMMNEASADFLADRSIIKMRKANTDFDYPLAFGYKKENRVLGSIISKAVSSITVEDKKIMNEAWKKEIHSGTLKE